MEEDTVFARNLFNKDASPNEWTWYAVLKSHIQGLVSLCVLLDKDIL